MARLAVRATLARDPIQKRRHIVDLYVVVDIGAADAFAENIGQFSAGHLLVMQHMLDKPLSAGLHMGVLG